MCGRVFFIHTWEEIYAIAEAVVPGIPLEKHYNVSPTQKLPVIRLDEHGGRIAELRKWGLTPSWTKPTDKPPMYFNAKSETLSDKPSFKSAYRSRRCLIAVTGFFEWQKIAGSKIKQPFLIQSAQKTPLFFAGLWETWTVPGAEPVETCTIITTGPNSIMAPIHDRMPVILSPEDFPLWLTPSSRPDEVSQLMKPCNSDLLQTIPVSTLINKPGNDIKQCIEPVDMTEADTQNSL